MRQNIAIQGYPGSFHDEAAARYFAEQDYGLVPAPSFEVLADLLQTGRADKAVMAIENTIAGTILPNYRILRERNFWIEGEIYLPIHHQLWAVEDVLPNQIREIHSHPMALQQCSLFLSHKYPGIKWVETEDTALSASLLAKDGDGHRAVIASQKAGQLYGLTILHQNIENNVHNFTRFFVISSKPTQVQTANKASVYLSVADEKGKLLAVLQQIYNHKMNLSKLQSFPVPGRFRAYYFHLDIEFDHLSAYWELSQSLKSITTEYKELGLYQRAHGEVEAHIDALQMTTP
ncbi:MAG: prephenate dehydratase domain-containing protein [Saprospiraceae bacterium]|nr:prephenate dehydratase domain-containing protein [Saprospiraceae bacterium]